MLWAVAIIPAALALLPLAAAHTGKRPLITAGSMAAVTAALALAAAAVIGQWSGVWPITERVVLAASLTPISALFAVTVPTVALPIILFAGSHEAGRGLGRLLALLAFFVAAMELLVIAADLVSLLVAWEIVGACSWALVGHSWSQRANARSAARVFLITRTGDLGLYIAAFVAFAATGSFAFEALAQMDGRSLDLFVAGVLTAAAAKSAQLPFSPWLYAAMAGPTPVSALLHAATLVAAGVYVLMRLHPVLATVEWFAAAAIAIGLATAIGGGLAASLQNHAKKLLAASTSAHYGLMWVAVGAGYPVVAGAHFAVHAIAKAQLFLLAGVAGTHCGTFDLRRMAVGRALPRVSAVAAVGTLALAGLPPLALGWSKEAVIAAAGHAGYGPALLTALAGGLSALYALRFQWLGFGPGGARLASANPGHIAQGWAIGLLTAAVLLLSVLWLPGAGRVLESMLEGAIPPFKSWELWLSLSLVAAGLYGGRAAIIHGERLTGALANNVAEWFALGRIAEISAGVLLALSARLARFDDHFVDGGIRLTARFGRWWAAVSARVLERAIDGAVEALGMTVGLGGRAIRSLQTGLTHHYYVIIAVGVVVMAIVLVTGR